MQALSQLSYTPDIRVKGDLSITLLTLFKRECDYRPDFSTSQAFDQNFFIEQREDGVQ